MYLVAYIFIKNIFIVFSLILLFSHPPCYVSVLGQKPSSAGCYSLFGLVPCRLILPFAVFPSATRTAHTAKPAKISQYQQQITTAHRRTSYSIAPPLLLNGQREGSSQEHRSRQCTRARGWAARCRALETFRRRKPAPWTHKKCLSRVPTRGTDSESTSSIFLFSGASLSPQYPSFVVEPLLHFFPPPSPPQSSSRA